LTGCIPVNGCTPHLVGVGDNRIGKVWLSNINIYVWFKTVNGEYRRPSPGRKLPCRLAKPLRPKLQADCIKIQRQPRRFRVIHD